LDFKCTIFHAVCTQSIFDDHNRHRYAEMSSMMPLKCFLRDHQNTPSRTPEIRKLRVRKFGLEKSRGPVSKNPAASSTYLHSIRNHSTTKLAISSQAPAKKREQQKIT